MKRMNDEQAFLQAIRAEPDADAPRLVYADWLEERGDPRGDFIRAQVLLHRARLDNDQEAIGRHWTREHELYEQYKEQWLAPLRQLKVSVASYDRGFVDSVSVNTAGFLKHGDKLLAAAPLLREVSFYWKDLRLTPALARCPWFQHVSAVEFWSGPLPVANLLAFARSPHTAHLRSLRLRECTFKGPMRPTVFAQLLQMPGLQELSLSWLPVGDAAVTAMAQSPDLARLRSLTVSKGGLTNASVVALAESGHLACTDGLALSHNFAMNDVGLQALARWPKLAGLTSLDLSFTKVGDAGIEALVRSPYAPALRSLTLSRTRITDRGVALLAACPALANLQKLDLALNTGLNRGRTGPTAARSLAASPHLGKLQYLDLSATYLAYDYQGVLALTKSKRLRELRSLRVFGDNQRSNKRINAALTKRFGEDY
jgi:uncharacterized protein (TIGR02996 family)